MNSRERVLTALRHEEPDRVPLDFWWSHEIKDRLLAHLGLQNTDELQAYLGTDLRGVYPPYIGPALRRLPDGSYEDFWGVFRKPYAHNMGGEYDEVLHPPLAEATSIDDIEKIRWPEPDWFDYAGLAEQCERYQDYGIIVGRMGREAQTLFIQLWYFRGLEQILLDFIERPAFVHALIERIMRFRIEHLKRILAVAKGKAHILQLADDYGSQEGPLLSRRMWREFFAPHLKTMADMAHDAGMYVFLHCDGGIRPMLPDLIELGVDILNPIQPHATGMEPAGLKRDFGARLTFHGGVDTQRTLPFGTPAEVAAEVCERIAVLGRGGGYILAPVHTVEPDVPLENILAVYAAAKACGRRNA
jgi:uroporphyrinogen decarboxylase